MRFSLIKSVHTLAWRSRPLAVRDLSIPFRMVGCVCDDFLPCHVCTGVWTNAMDYQRWDLPAVGTQCGYICFHCHQLGKYFLYSWCHPVSSYFLVPPRIPGTPELEFIFAGPSTILWRLQMRVMESRFLEFVLLKPLSIWNWQFQKPPFNQRINPICRGLSTADITHIHTMA